MLKRQTLILMALITAGGFGATPTALGLECSDSATFSFSQVTEVPIDGYETRFHKEKSSAKREVIEYGLVQSVKSQYTCGECQHGCVQLVGFKEGDEEPPKAFFMGNEMPVFDRPYAAGRVYLGGAHLEGSCQRSGEPREGSSKFLCNGKVILTSDVNAQAGCSTCYDKNCPQPTAAGVKTIFGEGS